MNDKLEAGQERGGKWWLIGPDRDGERNWWVISVDTGIGGKINPELMWDDLLLSLPVTENPDGTVPVPAEKPYKLVPVERGPVSYFVHYLSDIGDGGSNCWLSDIVGRVDNEGRVCVGFVKDASSLPYPTPFLQGKFKLPYALFVKLEDTSND